VLTICGLYANGRPVFAEGNPAELLTQAVAQGGFVWMQVSDPNEVEFDAIARTFDLHPLAVEDIVHGMQRPKLEDYGEQEFLVLKTLTYTDADSQVATGDVMFCLGKHFVVTVSHHSTPDMLKIRERFSAHPERANEGPYAVLHAALDLVVDEYTLISRELEADVSAIELQVFSNARKTWSQEIYLLKREVAEFRQAAEPLRPLMHKLVTDLDLGNPESMRPFFRDVEDHLNRAADVVQSLDDLLTSALNADLAQVQLRQNEDMRRISAWVALAAGPTMIAGIYGMNFEHMPELSSPWAYPAVLGGMALLSATLYYKFKKSDWL
jgi:magnesium transporter